MFQNQDLRGKNSLGNKSLIRRFESWSRRIFLIMLDFQSSHVLAKTSWDLRNNWQRYKIRQNVSE